MENDKAATTKNEVATSAADTTVEQPEEVTKRTIRVQTWKKIQDGNTPYRRFVFNRISYFTGAEKAATLLAETPEFTKATNIKVNGDRPQDPVKLIVVENNKTLFVPAGRQSSAALVQINVPKDADEKERKRAIRYNAMKEFGQEIGIDADIKLDLVIIGSCAVSRKGHRIGRGNGYVDLDLAILQHLGYLTPNTLIATTVHDCQVYDDLPTELFTNYDVPVDIIVTPTEVIRVEKRLPRPSGIIWHLLSERRLGVVPVLKEIIEKDKAAGKVITLKSEDTDVETNRRSQPKRGKRFFTRRRRIRSQNNKSDAGETDAENNQDENKKESRPRRNKRFTRRPRRERGVSEEDTTDKENKTSNNNRQRRRRDKRDFCIKVSNIDRNSRIRDLKAELRKRGCNPMFISWKGQYGKCYLHYIKKSDQAQEDAIDEMLNLLTDLKLSVSKGETTRDVPLKVEVIKLGEKGEKLNDGSEPTESQTSIQENRIETTDVTSV